MTASSVTRWTERIARADHLADRYPAAADILRFYAALAGYQQSVATRQTRPRQLTDLPSLVLDEIGDFLAWLEDAAPPRLAAAAAEMRRLERSSWQALVDERLGRRDGQFEATAAAAPRVFVVEALLQPLAERLAAGHGPSTERLAPSQARSPALCPFCGDQPSVGALREEAEGAKRSLVCGLCLTEWPYLRLLCPACGEQRFDALPVFTSETVPGARIDACDTCRAYVKTIDLTKDGHAVPCVDDLATVSLDLWAREQGYARLRSNLLMT